MLSLHDWNDAANTTFFPPRQPTGAGKVKRTKGAATDWHLIHCNSPFFFLIILLSVASGAIFREYTVG